MSVVPGLLSRFPLVAILRGVKPDEVETIGDVLLAEGFDIIEVPLNSPDPLRSIERLARRFGDRALVGAGTVIRVTDVLEVSHAGGRLIVMPHGDVAVVREARRLALAAIPGFVTPTEAFALIAAGADALKLFPAEGSSPVALKAMRAVLPASMPIFPVGGIDERAFGPWLAAGASGFGLGSSLYKPGYTVAQVSERARTLKEAWHASLER
jgi:2-dehydro-3-deoxyphosphogalactonate aldolase